jgi:Uncharacterized protein conserved in bacteria (DUF2171)
VTDPVSWFLIEPGWAVVDAQGREVGTVQEVVGDSGEDIFNGLAISTGFAHRPRYVPSEQVRGITEGRIQLSLTHEQLEHVGEFREPPASLEIGTDKPSAADRAADVFTDPESRPQPLTLRRRLLNRIFRRS